MPFAFGPNWVFVAPTGGGWNILADFTGVGGDEVDAVMGATLPTEGQEIIIAGSIDQLTPGNIELDALYFTIVPEPGKCPVPLPLARGGILQ
jgi:hypothetical protein